MVVRLIQGFTAVVLAHPRRAAIADGGVILLGASLVPQIRIADDARALVANGDPEIEFQLERCRSSPPSTNCSCTCTHPVMPTSCRWQASSPSGR